MLDLLDRLKTALADRYRVDREIGWGGMAHVFPPQRWGGRFALLLLLASGLITSTGRAQQRAATGARDDEPPVALATRVAARPPTVDGMLDDASWRRATVITAFRQSAPNDGADATEPTEVRLLYDDDALYVGVRLYDSDPAAVGQRLARRDAEVPSDQFWVTIDSYYDRRTAFQFGVNPAGVRIDELSTNDDDDGDRSWDPVWSVATTVDSAGWMAELRIPFSQLRFSADSVQTWGINFYRLIFRKDEWSMWSWVPATEQGFASHFGRLEGLRGVPAPRRLEVLPYGLAQSDFQTGADQSDPFNDGSVQRASAGVDVKYGLTSDFTLTAAVNPDFGQVEVDPAVVNLTAFETFFEERRPFFVEGSDLFRFGAGSGGFVFGAPQLFYSRRIGRPPSNPAEEPDGYVRNPTATSILGAVKLSGKAGGWSLGLLDALMAPEYARVQLPDGARESRLVEPRANYGVLSVRRDLQGGRTGIGAMLTGVHRDLGEPDFAFLRSAAYSGGLDFFHRFARNQWAVSGSLSASRIAGDSVAMIAAQTSSTRYYQRPDQTYVTVDSTATSMTGYAGSLQVGKVSGNWVYGTDFFAYSPGFEVNDAGFESRVDRIFHGLRLTRRWLRPGKVFRTFAASGSWEQSWNFGGVRQDRMVSANVGGQFLNFWSLGANGYYSFAARSDSPTRGGPHIESPEVWGAGLNVATDPRKWVSASLSGSYGRNVYDGWGIFGRGTVTLRPTSAIQLSFHPRYDWSHSIGAYVTQRRDPLATDTYGGRYLFAELIRNTFDATVRIDAAVTPNLSIQWYIQPFLSSGDYVGFKELAEPGTFRFLHYGVDGTSTIEFDEENDRYTADPDGPDGPAPGIVFANPDFGVRSLRSNLVVRWEYLPGSTLFVVWNHGRAHDGTDPAFPLFDRLRDLFRGDMTNTFLVKLNYWLSL